MQNVNTLLASFNTDLLDQYETTVYNDLMKKHGKENALQLIINQVEGDWTELSIGLAELCKLQLIDKAGWNIFSASSEAAEITEAVGDDSWQVNYEEITKWVFVHRELHYYILGLNDGDFYTIVLRDDIKTPYFNVAVKFLVDNLDDGLLELLEEETDPVNSNLGMLDGWTEMENLFADNGYELDYDMANEVVITKIPMDRNEPADMVDPEDLPVELQDALVNFEEKHQLH